MLETVEDIELIDPELSSERLAYRLFHEPGVRVFNAQDVRAQEQFFQRAGIHSVPAIIINRQHLISGGQPPEVFEQALRQVAGG